MEETKNGKKSSGNEIYFGGAVGDFLCARESLVPSPVSAQQDAVLCGPGTGKDPSGQAGLGGWIIERVTAASKES